MATSRCLAPREAPYVGCVLLVAWLVPTGARRAETRLLAALDSGEVTGSRCGSGDAAVREFLGDLHHRSGVAPVPSTALWLGASDVTSAILAGVRAAVGEDALACASFDQRRRQLSLNLPRAVRGEIATQSKLPIEWLVERKASLRARASESAFHLDTEGVFLLPFEGLQLLADAGAGPLENLTRGTVQQEARDVYEYFERHRYGATFPFYKASSYFTPGFLKDRRHKTARIWYTIRESMLYKSLVGLNMGSLLLYLLLMFRPMQVTSFAFADDGNNETFVGIKTRLDKGAHGATVNGQPADEYFLESQLHRKFWRLMGPARFQRQYARHKGQSFMSLIAALLSQEPYMTKLNGGAPVQGSSLDGIVKLLSICEPPPPDPGNPVAAADRTWACEGDTLGRVVWRAEDEPGA